MTTKMTKRKRKMVKREAKRTRARMTRAKTDRRLKMESRTEAKKKTAKRTTRRNRADHFRPKCALFGEKTCNTFDFFITSIKCSTTTTPAAAIITDTANRKGR